MVKVDPKAEQKAKINAIKSRMAMAFGVEKSQLSEVLDCSRNVINNWTYYLRVPYEQLVQCSEQTGVSMDWLLFGTEKSQLSPHLLAELKMLMSDLLTDALDFGVITETFPGGGDTLLKNIDTKLAKWQQRKETPR